MNASATYETTLDLESFEALQAALGRRTTRPVFELRVSDRCTMLVHVDWSDGDRLGISAPRCCAAATCRRGAP